MSTAPCEIHHISSRQGDQLKHIYTWVGLSVLSRHPKRLLKPRLVGPKPSCFQDRSQILLSYDTSLKIVTLLSPREHFQKPCWGIRWQRQCWWHVSRTAFSPFTLRCLIPQSFCLLCVVSFFASMCGFPLPVASTWPWSLYLAVLEDSWPLITEDSETHRFNHPQIQTVFHCVSTSTK